MIECRLTLDADAFLAALAEVLEGRREIIHDLIDPSHALSELARFDLDLVSTGRTGDHRILLKPSDRLAHLVAAVRAGKVDDGSTEVFGHESRSRGLGTKADLTDLDWAGYPEVAFGPRMLTV